ncbi:MAG: glycosyltransferase family 39 protein [Patescibacteria group bacterium]
MSKRNILILILIVSAALRLISLSSGDTINDEVFMSFRGLGMIDFDEASAQTTPLEWLDGNIPWWTHFSFHDHPPLVFFVQHIFMKILGENNLAFRLPSALLGIASVYLIYLLGALLYSENIGLIAATLLGTTLNNVYISRVGMQESYVIFFMLLASYLFLKSLEAPTPEKGRGPDQSVGKKYPLWLGMVLGLAFLVKYTSFILVPIFLVYLAFFKRDYFTNKKFWLAITLSIIIFSPVIIYNVMLYKTAGHFDFQFSYLFGQNPKEWQVAPGKEIGTLKDRIFVSIPRMISSNSWLFLLLSAFSILAFIFPLFNNPKETIKKHSFLVAYLIFLILLILKIGPSYRFLTMLTPFLALSAAIFLNYIYQNYSNVLKNIRISKMYLIILSIILAFEIFYSINNQIADYPIGPAPWLSSKIRFENYNWGYNELGDFFEKELADKVPALTFNPKYKFLDDLRNSAIEKGVASGYPPYPALIVLAGNFDKGAKLWTLDRLHIYHAWPIISIETYFQFLKENGFDYYGRMGFKKYYFVVSANSALTPELNKLLENKYIIPIYNKRGDEAFKIYTF